MMQYVLNLYVLLKNEDWNYSYSIKLFLMFSERFLLRIFLIFQSLLLNLFLTGISDNYFCIFVMHKIYKINKLIAGKF